MANLGGWQSLMRRAAQVYTYLPTRQVVREADDSPGIAACQRCRASAAQSVAYCCFLLPAVTLSNI
jgi:hypothetical protein